VDDPIRTLGALVDPVRRAAYETVTGAAEPIGRDEVAQRLGIGRTLAAFHLDKLVEAGLLTTANARRDGGPGAGRPAKLYHRSAGEVAVSVPERAYGDAAALLAETVDRIGADAALFDIARRRGAELGRAAQDGEVVPVLAGQGYEPIRDGDTIRLRNCPFHALAEGFPPLICGMNLALLEGLVEGAGWTGWRAGIAPGPDGCCVVLESKNNDH
jgi:predicted ArsR family transcriptional regulator